MSAMPRLVYATRAWESTQNSAVCLFQQKERWARTEMCDNFNMMHRPHLAPPIHLRDTLPIHVEHRTHAFGPSGHPQDFPLRRVRHLALQDCSEPRPVGRPSCTGLRIEDE